MDCVTQLAYSQNGIFQQVMHQLGIKHVMASAYHPQSQGVLEKYHQTLKTMVNAYCFDNQKDWDEGIRLLLFATREAVQESLGFSPFELCLATLCVDFKTPDSIPDSTTCESCE